MAVISYGYVGDERGGDVVYQGTRIRKMRIVVDSRSDNETIIASSGVIPPYLSVLPADIFYTLRRARVTNTEPWSGWTAELEYSNVPLTEQEKEQQNKPLSRAAVITWGDNEVTEAIDRDLDGKAIINAAGDYFDPPAERQATRWQINVQKNLSAVPIWVLEFENTTNESDFQIDGVTVAAHAARLSGLQVSEWKEEQGERYRTLSYKLDIREEPLFANGKVFSGDGVLVATTPKPWDLVLLNQGMRCTEELKDRNGDLTGIFIIVKCKDDQDEDATSPMLLDEKGRQLTKVLNRPVDPSDATYIAFKVYREKDFNMLPRS